jgi:ParB/RepB/Spo0J family partition protein
MTKAKRLSGVARLVVEQAQMAEALEAGKEQAQQTHEAPAASAAPAALIFPRKGLGSVPPESCRPWALADRPEDEFDHVEGLAESLAQDGQLQPAVVRPIQDPTRPELRYEIIAGQARWRAARRAGVPLRVLVSPDMDDEAAFRAMVGENEFRLGLSDFARAKRYASALERGLYASKGEMAAKLRISAPVLSAYLGFAKLDPAITARFSSMRSVSVRIGYQLYLASRDGYTDKIVRDAAKIESGEIGLKDIPGVWKDDARDDSVVSGASRAGAPRVPPRDVVGTNGRVLFSVKTGAAGSASAVFAKGVADRLDESFWAELTRLVELRLR